MTQPIPPAPALEVAPLVCDHHSLCAVLQVGALKGALEQERRESQDVADKLDKLKGQRNAAVRKASSLSKQMASMLHVRATRDVRLLLVPQHGSDPLFPPTLWCCSLPSLPRTL